MFFSVFANRIRENTFVFDFLVNFRYSCSRVSLSLLGLGCEFSTRISPRKNSEDLRNRITKIGLPTLLKLLPIPRPAQ